MDRNVQSTCLAALSLVSFLADTAATGVLAGEICCKDTIEAIFFFMTIRCAHNTTKTKRTFSFRAAAPVEFNDDVVVVVVDDDDDDEEEEEEVEVEVEVEGKYPAQWHSEASALSETSSFDFLSAGIATSHSVSSERSTASVSALRFLPALPLICVDEGDWHGKEK
jgi:hypothetical protein